MPPAASATRATVAPTDRQRGRPSVEAREVAAVRAALDSFITDFNNLDSARFVDRWSDDASAVLPFPDTPHRLHGRAAVMERMLRYFHEVRRERTGPPFLRMVITDVHVTMLGDGHALVTYAFDGGGRVQRRTLVMQRAGDTRWRIRHLHGSAHP